MFTQIIFKTYPSMHLGRLQLQSVYYEDDASFRGEEYSGGVSLRELNLPVSKCGAIMEAGETQSVFLN